MVSGRGQFLTMLISSPNAPSALCCIYHRFLSPNRRIRQIQLIRIRSAKGMLRVEAQPTDDIRKVLEEVGLR